MEKPRKKIFLVDDNLVNLNMGNDILASEYDVFTFISGKGLLKTLDKHLPDLILLDVEMPELNGYDIIKQLKNNNKTKDIPVIFLTAKIDVDNELEGFSLGAVDYIHKPFSPLLLLKRIEFHLLVETQKIELINYNFNLQEMVDEKTKTVVELQEAVLITFAELMDCRDDITGDHIGRTKEFMRIMLEAAKQNKAYSKIIATWDVLLILQSAQLHDVGKIAIKDTILLKPGRLTMDEFENIKQHVDFGEKVIDKIMKKTKEQTFLQQARILVSSHHERWDGSGYPRGLKGDEIPLQGRLMAIIDVYDALVSRRSYKEPYSHQDAVKLIANGKGSQFDPVLVDIFLSVSGKFKEIAAQR